MMLNHANFEFNWHLNYIYTDDDFQGPDIIGANAGNRQFVQDKTYGYTLGGPILKNRLFFLAPGIFFCSFCAGALRAGIVTTCAPAPAGTAFCCIARSTSAVGP